MTLVDVLAGITIFAATVVILAPLSVDARSAQTRTRLRLEAQVAIMSLAPPTTPSGSMPVDHPTNSVLRWTTQPAQTATGRPGGTAPAHCLVMQIAASARSDSPVLAERIVPRLGASP